MLNEMSIIDLLGEGPDYLDLIAPTSSGAAFDALITGVQNSSIEAGIGLCVNTDGAGLSYINNIQATTRSVLDEMTVTDIEANSITSASITTDHISVNELLDVAGNLEVSGHSSLGHLMAYNVCVSGHTELSSVMVNNEIQLNQYNGDIKYHDPNDFSSRSMVNDLIQARRESTVATSMIAGLRDELSWAKRELENLLINMTMMNSKMNSLDRLPA